MDIVEFAESIADVKLTDWQKKHLRALYEMSKNGDIYITFPKNAGRSQMLVYMNQAKELILNGATNDC